MKIIILAVLFCTFLGSCGDNTLSEPLKSITPTGYFPLHVGYSWKYQVYGGLAGTQPENNYILSVESTQEFKGKTYFKMGMKIGNSATTVTSDYYREENEKIYKYIGDKDSLYIDFNNQDTTKGYYTEIIDTMTTPVGTLRNIRCVKWIRGTKGDIKYFNNRYYAPNIGFIGNEHEPVGQPDMQSDGIISAKLGDKVYK